ncbi:TSC22 domain family protein 2-like [Columba livia]|uniref:TSC22 domain family protein 2-like n=1 Tax=Columba livia TaxID=8932 RepID=UPI0031BACFBD
MAWQAQASRYTTPAMAAPVPAHLPPTSQGLLVPPQPAQHYPVTYHLGQGSVWQGVPGTLGQLLQLPPGVQLQQVPQVVQLSPGVQLCHGVQQVQLPQGVQLVQVPQGVQLPPGPAAYPPPYPWGQQLVTGTTLVPQQPMGLGPWAVVQGQPLYPAGSYQPPVPARPGPPTARGPAARRVRSRPAPHTLPDTSKEPAEASGRDGVAAELSVPAAIPHQPALAAPPETSSGEPTGECQGWQSPRVGGQAEDSWYHPPWMVLFALSAEVTTKAALGSPGGLPQQEPPTCTGAAVESDPGTMADDLIAWLEATMGGDDVPDVADSPDLASFLRELPDLSGYVGHGSCPKQPAVALGMGNTNPHVHDTTNPPPASTSSPISPSTGQRTPAPESEWRW